MTIAHIAGGLFLALAAGSLTAWWVALSRILAKEPLLVHVDRRPAPWGLFDLTAVLLILLVRSALAVTLVLALIGAPLDVSLLELPPSLKPVALSSSAVIQLLMLLPILLWLCMRCGANRIDLGWPVGGWWLGVRQGLIGFVMLIPPVLLIQAVLTWWFPKKHPLIEMLSEHPDPLLLAVTGLLAVVVAPVVEEYLFRVLLQGWLQNVAAVISAWRSRRHTGIDEGRFLVFGGLLAEHHAQHDSTIETEPVDDVGGNRPSAVADHTESIRNPYESPLAEADSSPPLDADPTLPCRPSWWPIVVSSALFAAAHLGHGPAPIPLFLLALGLGFIYQRTHSVLPCIVIHMLLNAMSLTLVWIHLTGGAS